MMLLFVLNLICIYDLVYSNSDEANLKFDEALIAQQLHQSLSRVNKFLKPYQKEPGVDGMIKELQSRNNKQTSSSIIFLDYSVTNIWWEGQSQTGHNTPRFSFLTTPVGHGKGIHSNATVYTISRPTNKLTTKITPEMGTTSPSSTTAETGTTSPSSTTASTIGWFIEITKYPVPKFYEETTPTTKIKPTPSPCTFGFCGISSRLTIEPSTTTTAQTSETTKKPRYSPTARSTSTVTTLDPSIDEQVKQWLQEQMNNTSANSHSSTTMPNPYLHWIPVELLPRQAVDTIMTTPEAYHLPGHIVKDKYFKPGKGVNTTFKQTKVSDMLSLDGDYKWTDKPRPDAVFYKNSLKTTSKSPQEIWKEEVYTEMDKDNIGYMNLFLLRLTKEIATKKPKVVRRVLIHTEPIMNNLYKTGRISYLNEPLLTVAMNIAVMLSETDIRAVQTYSNTLHFMLKHRKRTAAEDINSIIDFADSLYEEDEGEHLLNVLKEFEDHPNIIKSDLALANDLIEKFMAPMRRLATSERRQRLLDSINFALAVRFPNLKYHTRRRFSGEEHGLDSVKDSEETTMRSVNYDPEVQTPPRYQRNNGRKVGHSLKDVIGPQKRARRAKQRNREQVRPRYPEEFKYEKLLRRNYYLPEKTNLRIKTKISKRNFQKRFNVINGSHTQSRTSRIRKIKQQMTTTPSSFNVETRPMIDFKTTRSRNGSFGNSYQSNMNAPPMVFQNFKDSERSSLTKLITTLKPVQREGNLQTTISQNNKWSNIKPKKQHDDSKPKKKSYEHERVRDRKIVSDSNSYSDDEKVLKINFFNALINLNKTNEIS